MRTLALVRYSLCWEETVLLGVLCLLTSLKGQMMMKEKYADSLRGQMMMKEKDAMMCRMPGAILHTVASSCLLW